MAPMASKIKCSAEKKRFFSSSPWRKDAVLFYSQATFVRQKWDEKVKKFRQPGMVYMFAQSEWPLQRSVSLLQPHFGS